MTSNASRRYIGDNRYNGLNGDVREPSSRIIYLQEITGKIGR